MLKLKDCFFLKKTVFGPRISETAVKKTASNEGRLYNSSRFIELQATLVVRKLAILGFEYSRNRKQGKTANSKRKS
jgi:hypothetical protein